MAMTDMMYQDEHRDFAEEAYWRAFCPECGTSPCAVDGEHYDSGPAETRPLCTCAARYQLQRTEGVTAVTVDALAPSCTYHPAPGMSPQGETLTGMPLNGAQTDSPAPPVPGTTVSPNGAQRPNRGAPGGTGLREEDGKVPCANYETCKHWVNPKTNKSGMCRACWTADGGPRRNAIAKRGQGELRKTEPEEQVAMLRRMFSATLRRAATEDPGRGLPLLLAFEEELAVLVGDLGVRLYRQALANGDGPTLIAGELTMATGREWRRKSVHQRWGPGSPAWNARPEGEVAGDE
jgi:hypothetical protein